MTSSDTTRQTLLERIAKIHRFMAKVGTNKIVCTESNVIHTDWVNKFARSLLESNREFAITSSGAIGLARVKYGMDRPVTLAEKQAYSAIGQSDLTDLYKKAFALMGRNAAQVLVTRPELSHDVPLQNARTTLTTLRQLGAIPVINENDSIIPEEIRTGDNDRISAFSAIADESDALIIISDVDGLYTANPHKDQNAKHIPIIKNLTDEMILAAEGPRGDHSSGGMITKLEAARIAAKAGIDTFIIDGSDPDCLSKFFNGKARCTYIRHDSFDRFGDDKRDLVDIAATSSPTAIHHPQQAPVVA